MQKVYIDTITKTCTTRNLDSRKIHTYFLKNNFEVVDSPQKADITILITCASVEQTIEQSIERINELQNYNAELIIAGCLPAISKEKLSKIFKGKIIKTEDLNKIDELFPENKAKFSTMDESNILLYDKKNEEKNNTFEFLKKFRIFNWFGGKIGLRKERFLRNLLGEHSVIYKTLYKDQFHIRVSWGCKGKCSYCVIHNALGDFKSKPITQCVEEFKNGLSKGYKHFVITGNDVGPYGLDIGSDLPELLDRLTKIPGDYEISIEAFNPFWVQKYYGELKDIFKRKKITSIYIPFQSGSSRILKLMNRYSDIDEIKNVLSNIRNSNPYLNLSADIIIGFPSESEEDFQKTLSFIKEFNFNFGLVYQFSSQKDTKAEKLIPVISETEIQNRMKFLKKDLKSSGYIVLYKTRISSFNWSDCLGFAKK